MLSIITLCSSLQGLPAWGQKAAGQQAPGQDSQPQSESPGQQAGASTPQASATTQAEHKPQNIKEWVSTNRAKKAGAAGAVAGAVLGALVARATGQQLWKGAAIGAAVGGATGYLIGRHRDRIYYGRDEAMRLASYDPSQGYVIKIQEVRFDPANIKPGDSATLHVRYLVIGPDPQETIRINCFRGIKFQETYVTGEGPVVLKVPHGGGIVESTADFTLPKEAPAGTYAAEAMLEDAQGRFNLSGTSPLYIAS